MLPQHSAELSASVEQALPTSRQQSGTVGVAR